MGKPHKIDFTIPFTVGSITTREGVRPSFGLTLGSTQRAYLTAVLGADGVENGGFDMRVEGVGGFNRVSSTGAAVSLLEAAGASVP